jgi:hypothetical protein
MPVLFVPLLIGIPVVLEGRLLHRASDALRCWVGLEGAGHPAISHLRNVFLLVTWHFVRGEHR